MILILWACSGAGDSVPRTGPCDDAPIVTYDNFGRGFFQENCNTCHAAGTPDRHGAPEEMSFDDADQIWALKEPILASSAVEPPTMPPQGGTTEDDREKLQIWLECGEKGQ